MKAGYVSAESFLDGTLFESKTGPKPGGRKTGVLSNNHTRALLYAMRLEGWSLRQIAAAFDVSAPAILKALRRDQS